MKILKGITWNHTRGYLPMAATAQRFSELHPDVQIHWEKRSLQEFADQPVDALSSQYDLLVVDHPFTGHAAKHGIFVPLNDHIEQEFLDDQGANSVGNSHATYTFFGKQWALAIDAATPISTWREDLLKKHEAQPPQTWSELIVLAQKGLVAIPAIAIDSLMNFYMLCVALGEEPAIHNEFLASTETATAALEHLRELLSHCSPECLSRNPIQTAEVMTQTDTIAYCPFAYGYSNYSRHNYARTVLKAGGLVTLENGVRLRSTLGGTGLAISNRCKNVESAFAYTKLVASPETQSNLYFTSGGQPSHRAAWVNETVNAASNNFFKDTLSTLDEAYIRPRTEGSIPLQDECGPIIHRHLKGDVALKSTIEQLNAVYREVFVKAKTLHSN
ncbi:MAG: extracellular solute-binding protein [Chthoniobacterales bacterium]